jgi:ABC-type iron transport system FetAB ATPase subunit
VATLSVQNLAFQQRGPFSFQVQANECISLTGPSGTGKTLLLRAIADLDPHRGDALLDNNACSAMSAPHWRRLVGLLPSKSVWWFDTVGEHFAHHREQWLNALGFSEDVLTWTVSRLSSGEQQRLSVLRMLQNQPQALLLDEPTANLDPENIARVEHLIGEYREEQQCAVIWVSHDREQARRMASRHLVLKANQLSEHKSL